MTALKYGSIHRLTRMKRLVVIWVFLLICLSMRVQAAAPKYSVRFGRKTIFVGEKQQIETRGKKITYTFKSNRKDVLTVSKSGLLEAIAPGEAVITIKASWTYKKEEFKKSKKYKVTVTRLELLESSMTLKTGQAGTVRFNESIGSRKITASSGNIDFARVSGLEVTAIYPGTTSISIQVGNDLTFSLSVTVKSKELPVSRIRLLVNQSGIHTSADLRELAQKEIGDEQLYFTIANPSKGTVTDGVYKTISAGQNVVAVTGGGYRKHFIITGILWEAHRGYLDMRAENTVDAFAMAGLSGAALIETDVRLTSDGIPVCLHNANVKTMTDGTGSIAKKSYEEVRSLKIDNGNGLQYTYDNYIPTLEQYLQICRRYQTVASIHLKTWSNSDEVKREGMKKIYSLIRQYDMQERCIVSSYDVDQLKLFCDVNGETGIPLGALDQACLKAGRAMNLPMLSMSNATKFGRQSTLDYSPLVGRRGKRWKRYYK